MFWDHSSSFLPMFVADKETSKNFGFFVDAYFSFSFFHA
jgi:hypothetical protein